MNNAQLFGIIFIVMLVVVFVPFAIIWALNTLFGLGIAYGAAEWLAVLILTGTLGASKSK